jgi:hypothetical protein
MPRLQYTGELRFGSSSEQDFTSVTITTCPKESLRGDARIGMKIWEYIYKIYIKLIIKYPYIQILDVFNFNVLVFAHKFSIMLKGTSHQINYA